MSPIPKLLNDDGSASVATALLMSHHGLRRDLHRFTTALQKIANGDRSKSDALREEWQSYRATLHGHHEAEDTRLFPHVATRQPELGTALEQLTADHRRIEPLLERGDRAFAELPELEAAIAVVTELATLLEPHLALEEAEVIPFFREAKEFPVFEGDSELDLYAQGFAWSSHGVAPEVLDRLDALLPEALRSRLPAARAAFSARSERVFGPGKVGASRTAIPER